LIEFHELSQVKLRFLEQFNFLDQDVLNWENLAALFLDLLANRLLNKFFGKFFECGFLAFVDHDFHHLFPDDFFLRSFSVACSLDLFSSSLGECDSEDAQHVPVRGLGLHERFHKGVPLLDQSAQFVFGDIHTIEVSIAVVAFDLLNLHFHFSPGISRALVLQVSQRYFENSASQTVSGDLLTGGLVARSDRGHANVEHCWNMHVVPFLSLESVQTIIIMDISKQEIFWKAN